jgi:dipeptidyl aminopeptidase/acylaminoacyl peptidase
MPDATDPDHLPHPAAAVPATLFDDEVAEQRWRKRFSAVRISLPSWARDEPAHAVYVSNETGRYEVYCWDVLADVHSVATDRPDGTIHAALSTDGGTLWWFNDTAGDEFGFWSRQEFGAAPGDWTVALPGVAPGYSAGLAVGASVVLAGFSDDDGTRIHLVRADQDPEVVYRHAEDGGVGALSTDETIWVLSHSEHGDSRYPALRAMSLPDGEVIAELSDAPDKGLAVIAFSPVKGDQRLLVGHERRGRDELLVWDLATGSVTEIELSLPGDLDADFYPDAGALLVLHTHAGRTSAHRYDLGSGALTDLPVASGVVSGIAARPDGAIWYRWSDAATPGRLRVLTSDGTDEVLLVPPGEQAPGSEPVRDVWVDGPGGRIHALLALPAADPGRAPGPWPTVFAVHGGPAAGDEDSFDASRAAWLDAGFAVVQVNYRGSTGYGSSWRDALTERIGHTELADIAAVHDHLISDGTVDAAVSVITGYSWGGFLTLLALGVQPQRWAAGVAGVPVADYVAAYEDEMEQLRAYDRALFGGSPTEMPDAYRDSSPLTYVEKVRAPVLVLAGENDPRCPIRQIDNYLTALAERGARYRVYRYDAGHGSMVVAERLRQLSCEIAFVRDALR